MDSLKLNKVSTQQKVYSFCIHCMVIFLVFFCLFHSLLEISAHKTVESDSKLSWPWSTFTNPLLSQLLTMPLFFSTGTHGYLYDTWNSKGLIVDYSYTSDCLNAKHTNSLLYTITTNGVEIFTSRLFPFISAHTKKMFDGCQAASEQLIDLSVQGMYLYCFFLKLKLKKLQRRFII